MPSSVVLVITALPVEFQAVRAHMRRTREEQTLVGDVYTVGSISGRTVALTEVGAGNASAAAAVQRGVAHFDPGIAIFVGVAGGVKDVRVGDVVAAVKVYGYERGKETDDGFRPRPDVARCSHRLIQRARAEARDGGWSRRLDRGAESPPKAYVAPIAAGEKVVASNRSASATLIHDHFGDALAVEMEGIGFLEALEAHPQVDALIIRGISDLLSGKAAADAGGSQERASAHAAAFAVRVLRKLEDGRREAAEPDARVSNGGKDGANEGASTTLPSGLIGEDAAPRLRRYLLTKLHEVNQAQPEAYGEWLDPAVWNSGQGAVPFADTVREIEWLAGAGLVGASLSGNGVLHARLTPKGRDVVERRASDFVGSLNDSGMKAPASLNGPHNSASRRRRGAPGLVSIFKDSPDLLSAAKSVLSAPDFPRSMVVNGRIVPNPAAQASVADLAATGVVRERLRGHMFLIVADDRLNHPKLYCYRSERWDAYLLPFYRHPESATDTSASNLLVSHVAGKYGSTPVKTGRWCVSVKQNAEHPDELWLYGFEFYSVVVPKGFTLPSGHAWLDLERLADPKFREAQVNGDVIRAVKTSFSIGLHDLQRSDVVGSGGE